MSTIIDSLIVELELDPRQFNEGQREAVDNARRSEQQLSRSGKEIEARGRGMNQTFASLTTRAVGFLAVLGGAKSLKDFATNILTSDRNTGLLANNLRMATEDVSAWQGAVKQAGGSSEDANASLQALVGTFQQIQLTGNSPAIPFLRQLGITSLGELRDVNGALLKMADTMQGMDPSRAQALGAGAGLTPGMVNLLMKGRGAVEDYLTAQKRAGVATAESAAASLELNRRVELLHSTWADLGRSLIVEALPAIESVTSKLTEQGSALKTSGGVVAWFREQMRELAYIANAAVAAFNSVRFALLSLNALRKGQGQAAYDYSRASGLSTTAAGKWLQAAGGSAQHSEARDAQQAARAGAPVTDNVDAAVRTIVTEARAGATQAEYGSVAHVIINRAVQSGAPVRDVVQSPGQFQVWMNGRAQSVDPNSPEYAAAKKAYLAAVAEKKAGVDPTGGATLFYSPSGQVANVRQGLSRDLTPKWATRENYTLSSGGQEFYKGAFPKPPAVRNSSSTVHSDVRIGEVKVITQATDGPGIAQSVGQSLEDYNYVAQANTGLN